MMVCVGSHLGGLYDGEVVHARHAGPHGGSQPRRPELHPGAETFAQLVYVSRLRHLSHGRRRLTVLFQHKDPREASESEDTKHTEV